MIDYIDGKGERDLKKRLDEARAQEPVKRAELIAGLAREVRGRDPQMGIDLASEALAAAREAGSLIFEAEANKTAGICYWSIGDFQKAIERSIKALEVYRQLGDVLGQASVHNNLGISYYRLNHYDLAIEHLLACLRICEEYKEEEGMVRALTNLANVYDDLGEGETSIQYQLRALELIEKGGGETEAALANNIGLSFKSIGDHQRALVFCRRALEAHRRQGNRYQELMSLINVGTVLTESGQQNEARQIFEQALDLSRQMGDRMAEGLAHNGLGIVYQAEGQGTDAEREFQKALDLAINSSDRNTEYTVLFNMAKAYIKARRFSEALPLLERGQELAEEMGLKSSMLETLESLAVVYRELGAHVRALDCYRRFHELDREINNQRTERIRQHLLAKFRVEQAERENESIKQRNAELEQLHRMIRKGEEFRAKLMEQLTAQSRQLEHLAKHDDLTGLYNRRHLREVLAHEFVRARRYREPLTVAMVDIDHFKQVNDSISHRAGDEVLKALAGILRAGCREVDVAARYGGEEFVLVFPNTDVASARVVCERLRQAVEGYNWQEIDPDLRVTVSIGICGDQGFADYEKMLNQADRRMYAAKEGGRNRIMGE